MADSEEENETCPIKSSYLCEGGERKQPISSLTAAYWQQRAGFLFTAAQRDSNDEERPCEAEED